MADTVERVKVADQCSCGAALRLLGEDPEVAETVTALWQAAHVGAGHVSCSKEEATLVRNGYGIPTWMRDGRRTVTDDAVIPAYLGWGNPERDKVGMRLYATDHEPATGGRWDERFPGGRVVEYAAVERFGHAEGDRFLLVHVGNRFTPDETMRRVADWVTAALDAGDPARVPLRDVVVLHAAEPGEMDLRMADLAFELDDGTLIVVLNPGETLETLDEEEMRAAGWVRADA